ncbi:V-type ATP synthase subunit D [Chlamydia sp. 17-3921]|uniref:V-type ATP synthase subunit D n=1 Tax=Chlamydia sp. 17-3921 TaxID=2675798 RepID=UPI001917C884|nr:V-type ATP synthase subunit D [Chlamydia sp. 17-3921]
MPKRIKLTKNAFRLEKVKLARLQMYLPTLKLKKALLQAEVQGAIRDSLEKQKAYNQARERIYAFAELFSVPLYTDCIVESFVVLHVEKEYENIAGVEVPVIKNISLAQTKYSLLDTPIWIDSLIASSQEFVSGKILAEVALQRQKILEAELRAVSIRVNLFEKKLIPETTQAIKKIAIFLSDRSITDIGQVKIAKKKIEQHKRGESCV